MAKPNLSYLDYLREAFHATPPVPGMGALPVNKLAMAGAFILGFANPGFWFAGAAIETVYLYALSTSERFQKVVQGKHLGVVKQEESDRINAMILSLDKASAERLNALNAELNEVNRLMDMDSGKIDFISETRAKTLGQLPTLFLRLLVTRRLVRENLEMTDSAKLQGKAFELRKQLEKPDLSEALTRSIKGNLEILERRLEMLSRARENLELIEMELNRIENQVQLVREEMAINRTPDAVTASVDRINATLGETEEWMSSHSEFFSRIGGQEEFSPVLPPPVAIPEKE
jgi:hypothetical protein